MLWVVNGCLRARLDWRELEFGIQIGPQDEIKCKNRLDEFIISFVVWCNPAIHHVNSKSYT
jgi:hypothetical protein